MSLNIFVGPMFCGKSSRLLSELSRCSKVFEGEVTVYVSHTIAARGKNAFFLHSFDHSGGVDHVIECDSLSQTLLPKLAQIIHPVSCLAIDEAQFFDGEDLFHAVTEILSRSFTSKPKVRAIFVAGLDGDVHQRPFPGSGLARLLPISDSFTKLTNAICVACVRETNRGDIPAPFTRKKMRVEKEHENVVDIGGAEKYEATCRKHLVGPA